MQRVADGEASALGQLYDRYGGLAFSLAERICADVRRAEDAVREVFVGLWRDPQRFDPKRGDFVRWLVSEVHRGAVNSLRAQSAEHRREVTSSYQRDSWTGGIAPGRLRDALTELSEEQRQIFVLAFYGGYTQPEIAALTGMPSRTVMARMFSASRRLRRQLLTPSREADTVGGTR